MCIRDRPGGVLQAPLRRSEQPWPVHPVGVPIAERHYAQRMYMHLWTAGEPCSKMDLGGEVGRAPPGTTMTATLDTYRA